MNDTSPKITHKMCELIQKKTPAERIKMGCSMHQTSKRLIIRAILESNPQITKSKLRQEIFLKFYGNDYDPATKLKILSHLANQKQT